MRLCTVTLALVVCADAANAQPPVEEPPPPATPDAVEQSPPWAIGVSKEDRRAALALFDEGNRDFGLARYSVALTAYRAALGRWDQPQIHYNAAVCLMQLGQPLDAFEHLTRALAYGQAPFENDLHAQALLHQKLLRAQLSELTIVVNQPAATIRVGNVDLVSGEPRFFLQGSQQLVVTKAGFETVTTDLELRGGGRETIEIKLARPKQPVVERRFPRWVPWTVGGVGLATAAVAGAFHIAARNRFDDFDDALAEACPDGCQPNEVPDEILRTEQSAKSARTRATIGYVVSGALVTTGIVMLVLNRERVTGVAETNAAVSPIRGGAMMSFTASF